MSRLVPLWRSSWDVLLASAAFAVTAMAITLAWDLSGDAVTDVPLYHAYGERVERGLVPFDDFRFEYPPGALAPIVAPALVTDREATYRAAFALAMAGVGLVGVLLAGSALGRLGASGAARRWTLAAVAVLPLLLGGVILTRFDLVPATLVAGSVLLAASGRLRGAALIAGLGAAVKLYPALLVPLLGIAAWRRGGRREFGAVLALGLVPLVAVYAPFLAVAPDGVLDSIGRQLGRPLQIESLGAGVLLGLHQLVGLSLEWRSGSGSQNLAGTAPGVIAVLQGVAQLAAVVAVWISFARGPATSERLVRHAAAVVVAFVAFSKVLSPQFLVWLVLLVPLVDGRRRLPALGLTALACGQTAVWFPARYWELVKEFDPLASWLVLTRGLTLVALLALLMWPAREPARARSRSPGPSPGRT